MRFGFSRVQPEGIASIDAQYGEELVRRMFARAWEDGKITKDEQSLLSEVVEFLGMHRNVFVDCQTKRENR